MARDWSVPVNSLLKKFQQRGFTILSVFDGEETERIGPSDHLSLFGARKMATETITSVDSSTVILSKDGHTTHLFLVLGNEPEELLADYENDGEITAEMEEILESFYQQWEGKKCPTIPDC